MTDLLLTLDVSILRIFNVHIQDPILDVFWINITNLHKQTWFQWTLAPALLIYIIYRWRAESLKFILGIALAVSLSDLVIRRGLKSWIERDRPYKSELVKNEVRFVARAGGRSFPSNHAGNVFAGASVLAWYFKRRRHYFYAFAAFVALSRVSLGVHFPSDVVVGAVIGFSIGVFVRSYILNRYKWFRINDSVSKSDKNSWNWRTRTRRLSLF